jgi:hypothetical protein
MKLYIAFEKETKQEFLLYNKVFQQNDVKEEQDQLIYAKEIFLKNLNLPYNEDIAGKIGEYYDGTEEESDDELSYENYDNYMYRGRTVKEIDEEINQRMKDYNKYLDLIIEQSEKRKAELKENNPEEYKRLLQENEENNKVYDNGYTEINTLIEYLNIDHVLMAYPYCGSNIYSHNVPYAFYSDHVIAFYVSNLENLFLILKM